MRSLALFLGGLAVVLLLLAFDERQTVAAVEAARGHVTPVVKKVEAALRGGKAASAGAASAAGVFPVLYGGYAAKRDAPTGDIEFAAAEIRLSTGEVWRTQPLRIAYGREALARPLRLADDDQIELRRIVAEKGKAVAASPLCQGDAPGYVGLVRHDRDVALMLFRAGVAPDQTDPGPMLCGHWSYRR